jgi:DNA adenine methylase
MAGTIPRELEQDPVPFVKWAGGKRSIVGELRARLPERFSRLSERLNDYWEPFAGGGALFFALHKRLQRAHLSDSNAELMTAYRVVQGRPEELIERLREHAGRHSKEYYYTVRALHELADEVAVAARLIYLNRTCYNGLYRVNSRGEFNVPFGRYKNPAIVDEANIMACSRALEGVELRACEFSEIKPRRGDFVYCDPPYHPLNSGSFTTYTRGNFTEEDQLRLADFAAALRDRRVLVMLSNSNTAFIRELYSERGFKLDVVLAPRLVNSRAAGRGVVEELIIRGY